MSTKQVKKTNTTTKKEVVKEEKTNKTVIDKIKSSNRNKRIFAIGLSVFIILLIALIVIASYHREFGKIKLTTNNKEIFDVSDLVINDLKYGDNEKKVINSLGNPKGEEKETIDNYEYKILKYDGATIYLKEYYNDYKLCKVEVTSSSYKLSRGLTVGTKITRVFRKFRIENSDGAYLYGNYTNNALNEKENKENIYFGVRTNENVLYVNRDTVVDGLTTNIAKLDIVYEGGKVSKVTWSYDIK